MSTVRNNIIRIGTDKIDINFFEHASADEEKLVVSQLCQMGTFVMRVWRFIS